MPRPSVEGILGFKRISVPARPVMHIREAHADF